MRLIIISLISFIFGQTSLADEHKHEHKAKKKEEHHHEHHSKDKSSTKGEHRRHKAHEHGHVKISIAVEGKKAKLSWESPAESVYGFEHNAKTDADKKKQQDGLNKLEANFFDMFAFAKDAGCELRTVNSTVESEEVTEEHDDEKDHHGHDKDHDKKHAEHHSSHAEVDASFEIECTKNLSGTELKFDIAKIFPNVKEVGLSYLSGTKQDAKELPLGQGSVKL